jgi:endonuclease/exonuclease/phosphatase family metal-dependent hydrolase
VSLQEVDRGTARAGGVDQALELARLTGMDMAYGKAMDYDGGAYGVAVLSRTPLRLARAHPLPHGEGREPRTALSVLISHEPAGEVLFIATHLQHNSEDDRLAEAKRINRLFVGGGGPPVILAGDLNAQPLSPPMDVLSKDWRDAAALAPGAPAPTWPSHEPRVRIDYVLLRPPGAWRVIEADVIDEAVASDHRPLLVVLQWQGR